MNDEASKAKRKRWQWALAALLVACCALTLFVTTMTSFSVKALFTGNATISPTKNRLDGSRVIAMPAGAGGQSHPRGAGSSGDSDKKWPQSHLIDVCGHGVQRFEGSLDDGEAFFEFANKFTTDPYPTLNKAAAQLVASADDSERAVGLYMLAFSAGSEQQSALTKENPDCHSTNACSEKYDEIARNAAAGHLAALAKIASTTNNPDTYATAYYGCRGRKDAACAAVTAARWSQLDPENAVAWIEVAAEASKQKNELASHAAMVKASQRKQYNKRVPALDMLLGTVDLSALSLLEQSTFLTQLQALNFVFPSYINASQYCNPALTSAPERIAACANIATLVANQDQSLLGQLIALSIGEKAGWDAANVKAKKDEMRAYLYLPASDINPNDTLSCENAQRRISNAIDTFKLGELEAAKKRMRANGLTTTTMVEQYRAQSSDKK